MRSVAGQLDFPGVWVNAEHLILNLFAPMQVFLLDLSVFVHAILNEKFWWKASGVKRDKDGNMLRANLEENGFV